MGDSKALAALLLAACCASASCAYLPAPIDQYFRKPGVQLGEFPEKVADQYQCQNQKLPWFKLEKLEVWPKRLRPGEELGHRLVYALCMNGATDVVTGKLDTRIVYRGKSIMRESEKTYELRPGRWIVDVFVTVPPTAAEGLYALELEYQSPSVRFKDSRTFVVEPPKAK
jgi:hypothetical protein